jgi:hypothetical protein
MKIDKQALRTMMTIHEFVFADNSLSPLKKTRMNKSVLVRKIRRIIPLK